MNAGVVVAIAAIVVSLLVAVFGGIFNRLLRRIDALESAREADRLAHQSAREADRQAYESKIDLAERTVDAKQETIEELRRQNSRLQITAELQDKFLGILPPRSPSSQPLPRGEGA